MNSIVLKKLLFWLSNGFVENGKDEYGKKLHIKEKR